MPEKGWYSITIRKETALKIKELSKEQGITVDAYINKLITPKPSKKNRIKCRICGVSIKKENFDTHMKKVHPKQKTKEDNASI